MNFSELYGDFEVLPQELLFRIFELVLNRWNLSLVNWTFYEIVCKIEERQHRLRLIDIDDDTENFESIINSRRIFDDVRLMDLKSSESHVTASVREIFTKFGEDIRKVDFYNSKLPESQFIEILSLTPNVETLNLYDVDFNSTEKDNVELALPKLRSLKTQLCNFIIPRVIFRLPCDTLDKLSINNCILDQQTIGRILKQQKSISHLEFDPYHVDPSLMAQLKLKRLKLMSKRHVVQILREQRNLLALDLAKAHIGDSEFAAICRMRQLQSLRLWIDRIAVESLESLTQLSALTELSLNYDRLEVEYVTMLSKLPLPTLTTLRIEFPKLKMLAENFIAISLNCPSVRTLVISGQSVGVLGTIVQYFRRLETLSFECDSDSVKVVSFPTEGVLSESLRNLRIFDNQFNNPAREHFRSSSTLVSLIAQSMPRLEKLEVVNTVSFDVESLACVLASNRHLTQLFIDDISVSVEFDDAMAEMLKTSGGNLDYFEFNKIAVKMKEKALREIFGAQFAYVSCREWRNQVILRNTRWCSLEDENDI